MTKMFECTASIFSMGLLTDLSSYCFLLLHRGCVQGRPHKHSHSHSPALAMHLWPHSLAGPCHNSATSTRRQPVITGLTE